MAVTRVKATNPSQIINKTADLTAKIDILDNPKFYENWADSNTKFDQLNSDQKNALYILHGSALEEQFKDNLQELNAALSDLAKAKPTEDEIGKAINKSIENLNKNINASMEVRKKLAIKRKELIEKAIKETQDKEIKEGFTKMLEKLKIYNTKENLN